MKILKPIILIGLSMTLASGCSAEVDRAQSTQDSKIELSQHFKSNLSRAKTFWKLYEDGLKQYEYGNYDKALELYKKALVEYSASKPTQAAAMRQIAISYEAMGNYGEAIKHYELASETTMSEKQRKLLADKAQDLRQKLALQPSA